MLKAALAGKVLQKGKTPVQYQFSEVKPLHRLDSSLEPSKQQGWLSSGSSSSWCCPCCCWRLRVWEEWTSSVHLSQSLGSITSTSPNPAPQSVLDTHGQGWPSLCALLLFSHLSSHSDPPASSFLSLNKQVLTLAGQNLLLSPCWLFSLIMTLNSLYLKITPPSPTFLLPWIRGFLRTQIT